MVSPATIGTRYIPCKSGAPHRCRAAARPANRSKREGLIKPGKGVQWLRAYLTSIAKRSGGARPWVEIDLNRCFNATGYSLSWGRELFSRLQRDPFWRNLCKVRYVQKRLETNGCFVILLAFRPYLKWDEEPLFYAADRKTSRHVRAALRAEDLELVKIEDGIVKRKVELGNNSDENAVNNSRESGHCPAHLITYSPSQETAESIQQDEPSRTQSSGFAEGKDTERRSPEQNHKTTIKEPTQTNTTLLRLSLNSRSACSSQTTFLSKPSQRRRTGIPQNDPQVLASKEGKAIPMPAQLRKLIIWLVFSLAELMAWSKRVPFSFPMLFAFVRNHVTEGHLSDSIQKAWRQAVSETEADVITGLCSKHSTAFCVMHAARILSRDRRTRKQRLADFYEQRRQAKKLAEVEKE